MCNNWLVAWVIPFDSNGLVINPITNPLFQLVTGLIEILPELGIWSNLNCSCNNIRKKLTFVSHITENEIKMSVYVGEGRGGGKSVSLTALPQKSRKIRTIIYCLSVA
jgi:hypothetical protein